MFDEINNNLEILIENCLKLHSIICVSVIFYPARSAQDLSQSTNGFMGL